MRFALQCLVAEDSDEKRISLRSKHLQYIEAHKEQIFCGGPTLSLEGQPEMMLIILEVSDRSAAEAFVDAEPYNQAGVFVSVKISEWRQILPESSPGVLLKEISRT